MILTELKAPVTELKGIGPKIARVLKKIGIHSINELLEYFPRAFSDRRKLLTLEQVLKIGFGTVKVRVVDHRLVGHNRRKQFLKILIHDGDLFASLLCFNRNFLKSRLTIEHEFYITGKFVYNYGEIQCSTFEYEEAKKEYRGQILPIYPLTEGLLQNNLRQAVKEIMAKHLDRIENDIPDWCMKKHKLFDKKTALFYIHFPPDFEKYKAARRTLVYEEFFFQKLFLLKRKQKVEKISKSRPKIQYKLKKQAIDHLPFQMTDYQQEALLKMEKFIFSEHVFSVLLQGDVGAGKTLVAILTMLSTIESGFQCALMVPTEVLAIQHYRNIKKMLSILKIDVALLTGSLKKRERDNILMGLKSGEIKMIIGTHSLFSQDVEYKNLGLAVIDEQHRFGVEQRYQLLSKGKSVDLLLMTATPIPQSLALSLYGDLDLVIMQGTIKGRKPVKTWVIPDQEERLKKMHAWIKSNLDQEAGRVIFVYPLIENSENFNYKDLLGEYDKLSQIYKDFGSGFIHSKVIAEEKDRIIEEFKEGKIKIIAATTVVEVGIDVPDATVIVIENADNYGLSTLHQLRGRVGRNNKQGYMILIVNPEQLTEDGTKRMEIIKNETDGFKISEADLLIRGPGDYIGKRQSGMMNIKLADIQKDMHILKSASQDAVELITQDNEFARKENFNTKKSFLQRLKVYMQSDVG